MPDIDRKECRRALDGWARDQGYISFDTYIWAGGSFAFAREDIQKRRLRLDYAMAGLYQWTPPKQTNGDMTISEEALARAEEAVIGELVDPDNAHAQGADHGDA